VSVLKALAHAATRSLLDELSTTPKPGLVDRDHAGAHRDLCFDRLSTSALALQNVFFEIADVAQGAPLSRDLREEIGEIGRRGERAMLAATGGSNTHRGALWAIGLLVAARASSNDPEAETIALRAGHLARMPDRFSHLGNSNGRIAARRYGARGARSEAAAGFPHVTMIALPALRAGEPAANVLLRLVASLDDTCMYHRGGEAAVRESRAGARASLAAGGVTTPHGLLAIERLDRTLLARNTSPGGCADLLAAALFLSAVSA
jgi:triphosphoribosyl-dephospho-CoA synthase